MFLLSSNKKEHLLFFFFSIFGLHNLVSLGIIWLLSQVPPAELENVLQSSPKILDAAVIPWVSKSCNQKLNKVKNKLFIGTKILSRTVVCLLMIVVFSHCCRFPQEDAGQIPVALVVRQPGCDISETEVMDYVAQQVYFAPNFFD